MDNNILLSTVMLSSLYGTYYTSQKGKGISFFTNTEQSIKSLKFFGFMIMYETIFGKTSENLIEVPERLSNFFTKKPVKLMSLFMIALSSTGDIEQSIFLTISFLAFVHLWRTSEERKQHPYLI